MQMSKCANVHYSLLLRGGYCKKYSDNHSIQLFKIAHLILKSRGGDIVRNISMSYSIIQKINSQFASRYLTIYLFLPENANLEPTF
jgi:hypothetical protein